MGFVLLDLQFYVYVLQIVVCPYVLFLLAIVLSVLFRYSNSDYPFGIFELFLNNFRLLSFNDVFAICIVIDLCCLV